MSRKPLFATRMLGCMMLMLAASAAEAAGGCSAYKWDVSREVQLYAMSPESTVLGSSLSDAPTIQTERFYALDLKPQASVQYSIPPGKRMLADGAHGGMLRFKAPVAGLYRVAIDSGFWLDLVVDGKPVETVDFNGVSDCVGPHKIVVFDLPANAEVTLQVSAASSAHAKLTVTKIAAPQG